VTSSERSTGSGGGLSRPWLVARQILDATVYGIAVTATVLLAAIPLRFLGGTAADVVLLTFIAGIVILSYATYCLLPGKPWSVEHTESGMEVTRRDRTQTVGTRRETRFQAAVQRLPPLGRYGLPPNERLSPAAKLFIAGVIALVVSIGIEALFVW
jgi:hypothetical protein